MALRKRAGHSQGALGAAVGVGQSRWSKVERGCSPLTVTLLCAACRVVAPRLGPGGVLVLAERAAASCERKGISVRFQLLASDAPIQLALVSRFVASELALR